MTRTTEVIGKINWQLLHDQRLALVQLAEVERDIRWLEALEGVTSLLESLVDAAIEDGIPNAELALLTAPDMETLK